MVGKSGRRARGEGGLRQRADGLWIGTVELGWGADGKRKRKEVSSRSQAECLRKMRELQKSIDLGVVPSSATVEQWMKHWMESASVAKLRPHTVSGYRTYVNNWIVPELGKRRLDRLTPDDVERMLRAMEDAGQSVASRRQARAVLQSALKVALREQKVVRNVAALSTPPAGATGRHAHLSLEDAGKVLRHLARLGEEGDWSTSSRFLVALLAGVRQGEALGLTWDNVVVRGPEVDLFIEQAVQRMKGRGLVVTGLKSASSHRSVPLSYPDPDTHAVEPGPAAIALEAWRADCGGRGFVWGGSEPTSPERDWAKWREVLTDAQVPLVPLHGARATTASILFDAGVPELTVAQILGHSQVQITRDRYIRSTHEQHARALGQGMRRILGDAGR